MKTENFLGILLQLFFQFYEVNFAGNFRYI